MLEKAYVRFRENIPDNPNTYAAAEGYALGYYGLASLPYARFLEARWKQLTR